MIALSERERQVLNLLAHGMDGPEVAAELRIAAGTVKNHVAQIRLKLHARTVAHAVLLYVLHAPVRAQHPRCTEEHPPVSPPRFVRGIPMVGRKQGTWVCYECEKALLERMTRRPGWTSNAKGLADAS